MIFEVPAQAKNFNLDLVWILIGVGFLCYVGWMIWMAIDS
jgi:hypothetical protein